MTCILSYDFLQVSRIWSPALDLDNNIELQEDQTEDDLTRREVLRIVEEYIARRGSDGHGERSRLQLLFGLYRTLEGPCGAMQA